MRSGRKVTRLTPGRYVFTVRDASRSHNFHLRGPGVNRTTRVAAVGTFIWRLTLRRGAYAYFDDANPLQKQIFKVSPSL